MPSWPFGIYSCISVDVGVVSSKFTSIGFVEKNNTKVITDKNTILIRLSFTIIVTYGIKNVWNIENLVKTFNAINHGYSTLILLIITSFHMSTKHRFSNEGSSIQEGITKKAILLKQGALLWLLCFPEVIYKSACTLRFFN